MKGGVEAPHKGGKNTISIAMSNTKIQDVGLLSSRRPEPV
jgi:hypothetical protein